MTYSVFPGVRNWTFILLLSLTLSSKGNDKPLPKLEALDLPSYSQHNCWGTGALIVGLLSELIIGGLIVQFPLLCSEDSQSIHQMKVIEEPPLEPESPNDNDPKGTPHPQ